MCGAIAVYVQACGARKEVYGAAHGAERRSRSERKGIRTRAGLTGRSQNEACGMKMQQCILRYTCRHAGGGEWLTATVYRFGQIPRGGQETRHEAKAWC